MDTIVTDKEKTKKIRATQAKSEEKRLRAAQAFNLCLVSVSQIIDYNDLYILDQEYDGILNNLNLEHMPKDEALLNILKQILDVITFFRKQEGEKALVEREYQQKMKNAIWSAVPSVPILAVGNPVAMAVSLATQIGTGYMNYRKAKAENTLEYDKQQWELYETAMEQFNALRRELFDTAWRLAEKYNFKDEYRLTERQITEYNNILMDTDIIRRYERLDYIKDNFKAYPPFWYFFGHTAAQIAWELGKEKDNYLEMAGYYYNKAIEYFKVYEDINKYGEKNLLREDELYCSCALEHIDLLLKNENKDISEIEELLRAAESNSGGRNDILELCAITWLRIGKTDKAERLLRKLVNSDYNKLVNGQMLSKIYANKYSQEEKEKEREKISFDYNILAQRCGGSKLLYPLEESKDNFIDNQKENLSELFKSTLCAFLEKYYARYNDIMNKSQNPMYDLTEMFDAFLSAADKLSNFGDCILGAELRNKIRNKSSSFKNIRTTGYAEEELFKDITEEPFKNYIQDFKKFSESEMDKISEIDSLLRDIIISEKLDIQFSETNETGLAICENRNFISLISENAGKITSQNEKIETIKKAELIKIKDKTKVELYTNGELDFNKYCKRHELNKNDNILAVLNDKSFNDTDLLFMEAGIVVLQRHNPVMRKMSFSNVEMVYYNMITKTDDGALQIGSVKYKNDDVDIDKLYELIRSLNKNDSTPEFIKTLFTSEQQVSNKEEKENEQPNVRGNG